MAKVEFIPGNERNLYLGKLKNSIGRIYGTTRWRVITFAKKGTKHAQDWEFASKTAVCSKICLINFIPVLG